MKPTEALAQYMRTREYRAKLTKARKLAKGDLIRAHPDEYQELVERRMDEEPRLFTAMGIPEGHHLVQEGVDQRGTKRPNVHPRTHARGDTQDKEERSA